jgi:hypothetical protein
VTGAGPSACPRDLLRPVPATCSESNRVATGYARTAATNRTADGTKARAAWTNRAARIASRFLVQKSGRLIKRLDAARQTARPERDGESSRGRRTGGRTDRGTGRRKRSLVAQPGRPVCRIFGEDLDVPGDGADLPPRPAEKDFGRRERHVSSAAPDRPSKPGLGPEIGVPACPGQRNCCPAGSWDDPEKSFLRPVRLDTWEISRSCHVSSRGR